MYCIIFQGIKKRIGRHDARKNVLDFYKKAIFSKIRCLQFMLARGAFACYR